MTSPQDYAARLKELVNQLVDRDVTIDESSDLVDDIGLASVEIMELVEQIEDEYEVAFPLNDLADMRTLSDLANELTKLVEA
jgi:acyl carrier protein